jgi:plastocyanin
MKRLIVLVGVLALVMSGCGSDDDDGGASTDTTTSSGGAYKIQVDGDTDAFVGEFATFTPSKFSVHPGDTVEFDLPTFSGVPHTVTFGTLVDKAVAKLTALGPQALPVAQEETPEMLNLPDVFNHAPPDGPPTPNQSAAQACYLASGVPPLSLKGGAPACAKVEQPAFDGKQAFYNSGVLAEDGDSWKMKLADDIAPGTYQMMCLIHRGTMIASMTVAADGESIPDPAAVTKAGKTEFDALVAKVKPAAEAARKLPLDKAALGSGDPTVPSVVVAEFGPKEISVPVGGTVVWNEFAFHTLSFNATDADVGVVTKNADGSWAFAPKAGPPAGFTVPEAAAVFPPPANSKPLLVDLGSYDGTGFKSTGITGSVPPQFIAFKIKFTKAGTIPFRCLVHPDMKGEVKVG